MAASVKASQTGLKKIDQVRRLKGWAKTEEAWYQQAVTSEATLKRFWASKPIQQETFVAICQVVGIEDWQTIADLSITGDRILLTASSLPSTYHESTWVERVSLTGTLLPVLQSDRRIIILTGMTGIGKTALAERLTLPLQDGKLLRRLNLDDGGITPDFDSSGAALLRTLGEEPTLADQQDARNLLKHILDRLRTHPHRIQIDSLEKLLKGNDRQGWSEFCDSLWLDLLQQVLASSDCQSQIILTTQDVPGELEAIGSRYPQRWHCQPILGLSEAEQLQLFQKRGIVAAFNTTVEAQYGNVTGQHPNVMSHNVIAAPHNANAEGQHHIAGANNPTGANSAVCLLKRIGKLYEGHPLVLRVIAEDIKTCGGDVQRYWQQCRFEELEANRPVKFSRRKLQLEVNQRVQESLERLPDDAKQLLCRSAVYRRPVPESFWLAMLPECTETQQQTALNLLKARTFAEEDWELGAWLGADDEVPLKQHNLIRSVAYEMLRQDHTIWEASEHKAAELWWSAYEPEPNADHLEKVRGYLEAFNHFYEVGDYQTACGIPYAKLNLKMRSLHHQLSTWGYFRELILIDEKLLKMAEEAKDINKEGEALGALADVHRQLGNYFLSIKYGEKYLAITRESNDSREESWALNSLGVTYCCLRGYKKSIDCHEQALDICRRYGYRKEEGGSLGNLGLAYYGLGDYLKTADFHEQHLKIAIEVADVQGVSYALGNLGIACIKLGRYPEATEKLHQMLSIFKHRGDRVSEATTCRYLAELYQELGSIDQAKQYCDRALELAIELGIPLVKECEELRAHLKNER